MRERSFDWKNTAIFSVFVLQAECKISFELFIKKSDRYIYTASRLGLSISDVQN